MGFCLLFIGSREGKGGGEGPSLVVTCSGYFESNKSTLSVYPASVLRVYVLALIPLIPRVLVLPCSLGGRVAFGFCVVCMLRAGKKWESNRWPTTVSAPIRWSCVCVICVYVPTERNVLLFPTRLVSNYPWCCIHMHRCAHSAAPWTCLTYSGPFCLAFHDEAALHLHHHTLPSGLLVLVGS